MYIYVTEVFLEVWKSKIGSHELVGQEEGGLSWNEIPEISSYIYSSGN
jgi:hypothetical protein